MCVVVCFIVFDNGFGFLVCILICVFEFYVMIKVKGMGFGLVMVKKIVDEYGVWIDLCNCMYGEIVEGVQVLIFFLQMVSDMLGVELGVQDGMIFVKIKVSEQIKVV